MVDQTRSWCVVSIDSEYLYLVAAFMHEKYRFSYTKPFYKFKYNISNQELGEAIIECLSRPVLDIQENNQKDFLKFTGYKSLTAYAKSATCIYIDISQDNVRFKPLESYGPGETVKGMYLRMCELNHEIVGERLKRQCGFSRNKKNDRFFLHWDEKEVEIFDDLFDELKKMGFFKYCKPENVAEVVNLAKGTGFIFEEKLNRCFHTYQPFYRKLLVFFFNSGIKKILQKISKKKIEVDVGKKKDLTLIFNQNEYLVCSESELQQSDFCDLVRHRLVNIINSFLDCCKTEERLYEVSDSESSSVVFLTPEMFELICSCSAIPDYEKPKMVTRTSPFIIS